MFTRSFYRLKSSPLIFLKNNDLIGKSLSKNLTVELCKKFNEQQIESTAPTNPVPEFKREKTESIKHASYFFSLANRSYKSGNQDLILGSKTFNQMCESAFNLLDKNSDALRWLDKFSMLRSLQIIGLKPDNKLVARLIEDLDANLSKIHLDKEIKVLLNQVQYQDCDLQRMFVKNLLRSIESKLDKISDLNLVFMIYDEKIINLFSKEFLRQIDLKALELAKYLSDEELKKPLKGVEISFFLHRLSLTKRRPKRLIQFLTNSLYDKDLTKLGLNNVISLVDSLSKLSYLSIELMKSVEDFLIKTNFLNSINNFDLNQLIKNFIKLRYEPVDLFNHLCDNVSLIDKHFGKKTLINMINAMAFFNYSREKVNELLNDETFNKIDLDLINNGELQIEYNWSLAFYDHLVKLPLNLFRSDHYTKILDKKHFYYLKPRFLLLYHYCKLNLGLDLKLPDKYFESNLTVPNERMFKIDPFLLVLKKDHYLTNVHTELGYDFDLVFVSNKNFETKLIENLDDAKKVCDNEFKLIYVYILDSKDVALNTNKKIGEMEMMGSVGKQMGYNILFLERDFFAVASIEAIKKFQTAVTDLI